MNWQYSGSSTREQESRDETEVPICARVYLDLQLKY